MLSMNECSGSLMESYRIKGRLSSDTNNTEYQLATLINTPFTTIQLELILESQDLTPIPIKHCKLTLNLNQF